MSREQAVRDEIVDALNVVNASANKARHRRDYDEANALVEARVTLYRATHPQAASSTQAGDLERAVVAFGELQYECGKAYALVGCGKAEDSAFTNAAVRCDRAQAELVATIRRLAAPSKEAGAEWVLVPLEPTEAMIDAALNLQGEDARLARAPALMKALRKIYLAMIAAANPPGDQRQEGAVLDRPARVGGRDFLAGELVQRVVGRAHAEYDRHHAPQPKEVCGAPGDGRACYPECACDTERDCAYGTKTASPPTEAAAAVGENDA